MTSFSWLHLTDFHQGMKEQDRLWPNVEEKFFVDLKELYGKCREPWDLVLFTGDLTQKGSKEEFKAIDKFLDKLWNFFRDDLKFPSLPKLLAVPGNHDLARPSESDKRVKRLVEWSKTTRDEFWDDQASDVRQIITEVFANYREWWERQPPNRKPQQIADGILPGDFSFTLEKDDAKLGILGLNTSFLQLTRGDFEGKLAIDILQFNRACCSNQGHPGPAWAKEHHACLLLTHHPPKWLNKTSQQDLLDEIIADNFDVHLCGHLHEAAFLENAEAGTEFQRIWQSRSLFGLEYLEENPDKQRLHGYTVGKIKLSGDKGKLFFWPRRTPKKQKRIIPDYENFVLDNDKQHTDPREFSLKRIHERSIVRPEEQRDDTTLNIQYCQTLIRSISDLHLQVQDWKILHEKLQTSSLDLILFRNEIMSRVNRREFVKIFKIVNNRWQEQRESIKEYINYETIINNEIVKNEIKIKYEQWLSGIDNNILGVERVIGGWLVPKQVENEIISLITSLSVLDVTVNELLARIDQELKLKVEAFEKDIKNIKKCFNYWS